MNDREVYAKLEELGFVSTGNGGYKGVFNKIDFETKKELHAFNDERESGFMSVVYVFSNETHSYVIVGGDELYAKITAKPELLEKFQIDPKPSQKEAEKISKEIDKDRKDINARAVNVFGDDAVGGDYADMAFYPESGIKNKDGEFVSFEKILQAEERLRKGSDGQLDAEEITSTRELLKDYLNEKITIEEVYKKTAALGPEADALMYQYTLTAIRHPETVKDIDKRPLNELDPDVKTVMDEIRARKDGPDLRAIKEINSDLGKTPPADYRNSEQKAAAQEIK